MKPIDTPDDVAAGLDALRRIDPRLEPVIAYAGQVPLRRIRPGFASFVQMIVAQQVSKASAEAIFSRLNAFVAPLTAEAMHLADDGLYRAAGFSRPKVRTVRAVAAAVLHEGLDLDHMCTLEAEPAIVRMTAVHGIGRWTAEVYLLFAAGHPDIFPARDVALQTAVGHAFGIDPRPGEKALMAIAESWSPWRGIAARLFWAYYAALRWAPEPVWIDE